MYSISNGVNNLIRLIELELKELNNSVEIDIPFYMAVVEELKHHQYQDLHFCLDYYDNWWVTHDMYNPHEDNHIKLYVKFLNEDFQYTIALGYEIKWLGYCQCKDTDEGYDPRYKCTGKHCDYDIPIIEVEKEEYVGCSKFKGTQKDLWNYIDKYNKIDKDVELEKKNAEIKELEDKIKELQNKLDNIKEG